MRFVQLHGGEAGKVFVIRAGFQCEAAHGLWKTEGGDG